MPRSLPSRPNLEYLRKEAKSLLAAHRSGDPSVRDVLRLHHRFRDAHDTDVLAADVSLQEMQHALALDYGFGSWRDLKAFVEKSPTTPAGSEVAAGVLGELREKGNAGADEIAALACNDDAALEALFQGACSEEKRIKNAAAKALKLVSEANSARLYHRLEFFTGLLDGEDNILRWIATDVIGNLAGVDEMGRVDDELVDRLIGLVSDDVMITAAHAVENLGKIALGKPGHRRKVTAALLRPDHVDRAPECHNILAGKRLLALGAYCQEIEDVEPVRAFAEAQLDNPRNATGKKAEKLLRRLERNRSRPT